MFPFQFQFARGIANVSHQHKEWVAPQAPQPFNRARAVENGATGENDDVFAEEKLGVRRSVEGRKHVVDVVALKGIVDRSIDGR